MSDDWADVWKEFKAEMRRTNMRLRTAPRKTLEWRLANIEARCDHWQPIIEAHFHRITNPIEEDASILIPIADVRDAIAKVRQSLKAGDYRAATFAISQLLRDDAELTNLLATFGPSPGQLRGTFELKQKADRWRTAARAYDQKQLKSDPRWETLSKNARAKTPLAHLIRKGMARAGKGSAQESLAFETVRRCLFPSSGK